MRTVHSQEQASPGPGPGQTTVYAGATPRLVPFAQLQAQDAQLAARIRDLRAQRQILLQHLRSNDQGMMSAASTELQAVDLKIKALGDEQASVKAQMALQGPPPAPKPGEPGYRPNRGIEGEVIGAIGVTFTLAVLMPIAIAYARRLWRRSAAPAPTADNVGPRLDRIEQAVEAIAIEIERVSEGQRFVTKVMTERPAAARSTVRAITPDPAAPQQQAIGEAASPFLALGAGPAEAIRINERQKVKPSITPH